MGLPEGLEELINKDAFDRESEGVLVALIKELRQQTSTSCVRFWITRALEAFLRGETITINQNFLLQHNLIEVP